MIYYYCRIIKDEKEKKTMKKIIISIFAIMFGIGLSATSAFATGTVQFNTDPQDPATVLVSNFTKQPCSNGGASCWHSSVSADAGDVVSVQIYYHNTGTATANNVAVEMTRPSGTKSSFSMTGVIMVNANEAKRGSASINLTSAQTLTFIPGSIEWSPNQSGSNGQGVSNESALFNRYGLPVGNIAPGWASQGTVVASFKVSNAVAQSYQCSDDVDNDGDGLIDYPNDPGCTSATDNSEINTITYYQCNDGDDNDNDGYIDYPNDPGCSSPTDNSEYNAVTTYYQCNDGIDNDGDGLIDYPNDPGCSSATDNSEINTVQNVCRIDTFTADDRSIDYDTDTTLRWNTTNCSEAAITYIGSVPVDGSVATQNLRSNRTYTLSASNATSSDTEKVTITVTDEVADDECKIDEFKADDYSIDEGDSTRLRWETTGCDSVKITPDVGSVNDDGSESVSPSTTRTYTITGRAPNGDTDTDSLKITVDENNQPTVDYCAVNSFYASSTVINQGSSTTLYWNTNGFTSVQILPTFGTRNNNGSVVVSPSSTTTYTLYASGGHGCATVIRAVTVSVQTRQNPVIINQPPRVIVHNVVVGKSTASLLELSVESPYDHMCINGQMDYTVKYRNISRQTLQNAVLQVNTPKEITYVSSSRGSYESTDRKLTISLGDIAAGEEGTIVVHAEVNDNAIRGNLTVVTASVVYTNTQTRAQENAIAYATTNVSDDCPSSFGASVFGFGAFLPDTLLEWLILILVILALVMLSRQMFKKNNQPAA